MNSFAPLVESPAPRVASVVLARLATRNSQSVLEQVNKAELRLGLSRAGEADALRAGS